MKTRLDSLANGGPDADPLSVARGLCLQELLAPMDLPIFLNDYWGRSAWSHRIRSPRFDGLMNWQRLSTLIRDHTLIAAFPAGQGRAAAARGHLAPHGVNAARALASA
jgi:hypothetical protein